MLTRLAGSGRTLGVHREAQADRVPRVRVRVLAHDQDPDLGERSLEGAEDVLARRLVGAGSVRRKRPSSMMRSSTGASASAQSGAIRPLVEQSGDSLSHPGMLA